MTNYEAASHSETDDDLWHVQMNNGDICLMTLDQLDDAFQTSVIDEETYVWQEGATDWVTLRDIAGIDSDEEVSVDISLPGGAELQGYPYDNGASHYASTESAWPPAPVVSAWPDTSYAPPSAGSQYASRGYAPYSTAPVASDIGDMDFDIEPVNFRSRKRSVFKWVCVLGLIGGVGFGIKKYNLYHFLPVQNGLPAWATAAAGNPNPATQQLSTPPSQPQPVAAPAPPVVEKPATPSADSKDRLSDDQKRALADADKTHAEKQKQKQLQRQQNRPAPRAKTTSMGNPFHKGGSRYDPLNASL